MRNIEVPYPTRAPDLAYILLAYAFADWGSTLPAKGRIWA